MNDASSAAAQIGDHGGEGKVQRASINVEDELETLPRGSLGVIMGELRSMPAAEGIIT
jgi:hypothetical protein